MENKLDSMTEKPGIFLGSMTSYQEAQGVIIGIPMDYTVSYRPGTRSGPLAIRNVSIAIEDYSIYLDRSLLEYKYCDLGDLGLPFGNVKDSLDIIEKAAESLLEDKKFPIFLGGEHLVSYPIIKAFAKRYPDLHIVHFDAHADLRSDYYGEESSHSTVMRKASELLGPSRIYQFGIRSGIKDEFDYAKKNTRMFTEEVVRPLQEVISELKDKPVYVSLDIDVVDPAYAPGTGTQEPGGCTSREIIQAVHLLGQLKVVGFDLVEVSPQLDFSERTALLAAKLIRESILSFLK